jgi:lipid-binding SYLF domain-containing protein
MTRTLRSFVMACGTAAAALLAMQPAAAQSDQQALVDAASVTFGNFVRDPEMTWIQKNLPRARAVIIAPQVTKAGFIVGGSGGRAIVVAKDAAKGTWRGPVFYTLATGSIGFQAGVSVSEIVTLVMTDKGLNSLLATSFKMGGDASVAAGPVGAGASADIVADLVTFSRAKGVYGGLNLDGTVVSASDEWNQAYYGKPVLPPDVLVRGTASNPQGAKLVGEVAGVAGGK